MDSIMLKLILQLAVIAGGIAFGLSRRNPGSMQHIEAAVESLARGVGWHQSPPPQPEPPACRFDRQRGIDRHPTRQRTKGTRYSSAEGFLQHTSRRMPLGKDHRPDGWEGAVFSS
jgi:hypothetical protein